MRRRLLSYTKTITPEPTITYEYDNLTIDSFSYSIVDINGTAISPTYSYHYVKYTLEDGVRNGESVTVYNTSSNNEAIHSFSIANSRSDVSFNTSTGQISCNAATITDGGYDKLGDVTLKVIISDKSESKTVEVQQANKTELQALDMDVLFFNIETHEHSICDHTKYNIANWPVEKFVPIGIVAIPESHNRYSGKYVGVVALNNATTVQSDLSMTSVMWGGRDASEDDDGIFGPLIEPTEECLAYLKYNGYDGTVYDSFQGAYDLSDTFFEYPTVGMPSDMYTDGTGYDNPLDIDTKYYLPTWGAINEKYCVGPSPYYHTSSNDTYSSLYGSGSAEDYSQCDVFDGEGICWRYLKKMTDIACYYQGWIEDNEIANVQTMMPALEACWRYAPEGSAEGCWHLPTSAEFAYVISRADLINNTINQLNSIYGTSGDGIKLDTNSVYLTAILAANASDYHQYAIAHRNHGYTGFEVDVNAVCRPMKKVYTAGVTNGVIGYESIPTYSDDDTYNCHWGVYRHEDADNVWGSGDISGTVYGVRIRSFDDWTVIRDNVPLFTFNNLSSDYYGDSAQFGRYDTDAEPGWYLVKSVSLSNGDTINNINQNLDPASDWTGTVIDKSSWTGRISTCYKYYDMQNRGNGTGLGYDKYDYAINKEMYPFRVGFWNYDTAFVFHPSVSSVKDDLPWKYCYENMRISFPRFERTNVRNETVENSTEITMMELAVNLDLTEFSSRNLSNPALQIRIFGEIEDFACIMARGSATTSGGLTSYIYMKLVMVYDDGSEEEVQSWSVVSNSNSETPVTTYLDNGTPTSGEIVFPVKTNGVGTLKLVMTGYQIAKFDSSLTTETPMVALSTGEMYVTYTTT